MKLKNLLLLLSIFVAIVVSSFSVLAYQSINSLGDSMRSDAAKAAKYAMLLNETRAAQVAFQVQVQEWKNILIRGNDKELYAKYLKGFESQARDMDTTLARMKTLMAELKMSTDGVDKLLEEHAKLGSKYTAALSTWEADNELTGKAVDKLLRGIDRPTSAALSELGASIEKSATESLAKSSDDAARQVATALDEFYVISGVALLLTIAASYYIGRSVLRRVGSEPAELADAFAVIAQGDLTKPIAVREGDTNSIAASAAMMQMRMRMMIKSVHNGARELDAATEKAGITSSLAEVKDALREAKQAIKGLETAADRFKA